MLLDQSQQDTQDCGGYILVASQDMIRFSGFSGFMVKYENFSIFK